MSDTNETTQAATPEATSRVAPVAPDREAIQYVHDLLQTLCSCEAPVCIHDFGPFDATALAMTSDALCWALGHDGPGARRFAQAMLELEKTFTAAGCKLVPAPDGHPDGMGRKDTPAKHRRAEGEAEVEEGDGPNLLAMLARMMAGGAAVSVAHMRIPPSRGRPAEGGVAAPPTDINGRPKRRDIQ